MMFKDPDFIFQKTYELNYIHIYTSECKKNLIFFPKILLFYYMLLSKILIVLKLLLISKT